MMSEQVCSKEELKNQIEEWEKSIDELRRVISLDSEELLELQKSTQETWAVYYEPPFKVRE